MKNYINNSTIKFNTLISEIYLNTALTLALIYKSSRDLNYDEFLDLEDNKSKIYNQVLNFDINKIDINNFVDKSIYTKIIDLYNSKNYYLKYENFDDYYNVSSSVMKNNLKPKVKNNNFYEKMFAILVNKNYNKKIDIVNIAFGNFILQKEEGYFELFRIILYDIGFDYSLKKLDTFSFTNNEHDIFNFLNECLFIYPEYALAYLYYSTKFNIYDLYNINFEFEEILYKIKSKHLNHHLEKSINILFQIIKDPFEDIINNAISKLNEDNFFKNFNDKLINLILIPILELFKKLSIQNNYGKLIQNVIYSDIRLLNNNIPNKNNLSRDYIYHKLKQCKNFIDRKEYKNLIY